MNEIHEESQKTSYPPVNSKCGTGENGGGGANSNTCRGGGQTATPEGGGGQTATPAD